MLLAHQPDLFTITAVPHILKLDCLRIALSQAMAVIDRIHRALASISEHIFSTVDPVARSFGEAFGADSWAVQLFAEEVIRGGPAFAVSLVLNR